MSSCKKSEPDLMRNSPTHPGTSERFNTEGAYTNMAIHLLCNTLKITSRISFLPPQNTKMSEPDRKRSALSHFFGPEAFKETLSHTLTLN